MEQKINELVTDKLELQKKLLAILAKNSSNSDKEVDSNQSSEEGKSDYDSCPIKVINAITNWNQKEFLIDLIGKISDEETRKEYLSKHKDLILLEQKKVIKIYVETLSLTKLFHKYPVPNPFQQLTTKDIQIEVNELKAQVRDLRQEIINLKATDLELHTKLSTLETQIPRSSHVPHDFRNIENTRETAISEEQFLHTISQVKIQNWHSTVKIVFNDFHTSAAALIDIGVD